ncbi:hypothetical protein TSH100_23630 [Azospirillum sp. TSH100]|uniref:VWA domain-containing protein n=1 Tax=Azospirillum sp. TSH100 TaxID=652764 RepID=UPI000D615997|nr:vWA domain-containing protein [Azospirillum sp. TSH100]PWC82494.1 hypothetical protein TSH100_23630 [Azospirillum sp. TSH100]QCG89036.1 VWA domain-containing protein [Azospirillum sp. TSH100]
MPAERVTSKSPWHVVFIIDDSGSMSGQPSSDVNQAMETMIEEMRLLSQGKKPYFKVSVISFGSDSKILAKVEPETQINLDAVMQFAGNSGSTNAAAALSDACQLLSSNGGAANDFEPFVFFLSDGAPDNEALALEAGRRIKALSVAAGTPRIVTIGFGQPNDQFMTALATTPELYKRLQVSSDIRAFLPAIGTVAGTNTGADGVAQAIMQL